MLIVKELSLRQSVSIKKSIVKLFLLLSLSFIYLSNPLYIYGNNSTEGCEDCFQSNILMMNSLDLPCEINQGQLSAQDVNAQHCKKDRLTYYIYIADFANSFIQSSTSNVTDPSSTVASSFLAGRAAVYNKHNKKVGTCSASFLNMQNADGIFTDISNYFSVDSGLIVSWFTPTTLINLELDSIIRSMVTKCIVVASTKIGYNPFYGQTFDLVVSSDDEKIYFQFTRR